LLRSEHTTRDARDLLIEALGDPVGAYESVGMCEGREDWERIDAARDRVRLAEAALAAEPEMRRVGVPEDRC